MSSLTRLSAILALAFGLQLLHAEESPAAAQAEATTPENAAPEDKNRVYKTVNKDGTVSFSSSPQNSAAKKVEVKQANSISLPKAQEKDADKGEKAKKKLGPEVHYTSLTITSPTDKTVIRNKPMPTSLDVNVEANPKLDTEHGHQFQYQLNGATYGSETEATSITLTDLNRGSYSITVNIVNKFGDVVMTSSPVTVSIFQTSELDPNNPNGLMNPANPISPINPKSPYHY